MLWDRKRFRRGLLELQRGQHFRISVRSRLLWGLQCQLVLEMVSLRAETTVVPVVRVPQVQNEERHLNRVLYSFLVLRDGICCLTAATLGDLAWQPSIWHSCTARFQVQAKLTTAVRITWSGWFFCYPRACTRGLRIRVVGPARWRKEL